MENVIVVFPKPEDGRKIRTILIKNGINVDAVCTSGAQALENTNKLNEGIVICSYRFNDMYYTKLNDDLPKGFDMLLIASQSKRMEYDGSVISLEPPVKPYDLLNTVNMMFEAQHRRHRKSRNAPKFRTEEENRIIKDAKNILMDRNGMTEPEAHAYMQKCSMDSGTGMVETAQMVICLYR